MEPDFWKSEPGHTRSYRYHHRSDRLRQNSRKPASTKRFPNTLANPILCVCWCIRGCDVRLPIGNVRRIRSRGPEAARRFPRTRRSCRDVYRLIGRRGAASIDQRRADYMAWLDPSRMDLAAVLDGG